MRLNNSVLSFFLALYSPTYPHLQLSTRFMLIETQHKKNRLFCYMVFMLSCLYLHIKSIHTIKLCFFPNCENLCHPKVSNIGKKTIVYLFIEHLYYFFIHKAVDEKMMRGKAYFYGFFNYYYLKKKE